MKIAGTRWAIEECFQTAKNEDGLDHYQVHHYDAWYRHIALAMLTSPSPWQTPRENERGRHFPLSLGEARRLLAHIITPQPSQDQSRAWSHWRR